ncbi:MAG TPA: hypothetical protein VFJ47_15070 [Terriglobales bacterium]|nr:hypothetical protein [Terriglobales bacterium]
MGVIPDSKTSLKENEADPVRLISPIMDNALTTSTESAKRRPSPLRLWTHRIGVLIFVFVCATLGVLLVILPWHAEWTDNRLLLAHPDLRSFVAHGFVRGFCSGLGLLDIWIGFWEAIHYHEDPSS